MKFYVDIYLDHNLGDDLFLDTLLQRYPEHEFNVGVPGHIHQLNEHFKKYHNIKIVKPIGIKNILDAFKYDVYVLIGGSIYMDLGPKFHRIWLSRLIKSMFFLLKGKPFFVIGANLGPFNTRLGKILLWMHFNLVRHISVRDAHSYNILKKWKIFNTYSMAPDVVFSHKSNLNSVECDGEILGISVINTKRHVQAKSAYIDKMRSLITHYLGRSSENKVLIMGFDGGLENDDEVIQEILKNESVENLLASGRIEVINYSPQIDMMTYLNKINQCKSIVCSRFHAMILAMKYNKRIYPICYSEKMENVLLDMKSQILGIKYENIGDLRVNDVLDNLMLDNSSYFNKKDMDAAEKHFSCIDVFIESRK